MSTIQPPPGSTIVAPALRAAQVAVVSVLNPTPDLIRLAPNTTINAEVLASVQGGRSDVQTPLGRFEVQSPTPLEPGQSLVLQALTRSRLSGTNLLLQVVTIDGVPPQNTGTTQKPAKFVGMIPDGLPPQNTGTPQNTVTTAATNLIASPPEAAATQKNALHPQSSIPPSSTVSLSVGSKVSATILTLTPTFSLSPGQITSLQNHTSGTLNQGVIDAGGQRPNLSPITQQRNVLSPSTGQGQQTSSQPPAPTSINPVGPVLLRHAPGEEFQVTIQSISPPTPGRATVSSTIQPQPFLPGLTLTGTAIAQPHVSGVTLSLPGTTIRIPSQSPVPAGTEIVVKVESFPQPPSSPTIALSPNLREGMVFNQQWPGLEESYETLKEIAPAVAQQLADRILPQPNARLTSTALFFLSALRGGDIRSWIGEHAIKILGKLKPDLLRQLTGEFRVLGGMDEEGAIATRTADWRATLLPMLTGDSIEHIRLYTRYFEDQTRAEGKDGETPSDSRFLIDVTLSNIGRIQLDGMVGKQEKRLDMIIRTSQPLPKKVRSDMMDIFESANDIVGLNGAMTFQAAPDVFVEFSPETSQSPDRSGVIV